MSPTRRTSRVLGALPWLLAVVGLTLAFVGFGTIDDSSPAVRAYRSLQLVGLEDAANGRGGWELDFARFLLPIAAILLTAEAATTVFVLARDRRWGVIRARNHHVVCGYGRTGQAIVAGLRKEGRTVIVVREVEVAALTHPVPVVRGDARDPRTLRQARVHHAHEVWVACGADAINAEVATQALALFTSAGEQCVRFGVRESRTHRALRPLPKGVAAFDLNAAAARQMVNRTVAETDGTSLIIGFGKLGQAVATELLRLGFRRVLAVDRRAEMKAAELRRRCGVQTAAQMRGIVVEFDYDDLAAVAGDAGARITSVFVCVNDDAMNVALGHEAAQSFPGVTVSVRMSSLTSGIGLLMTKQPDTPRIRFVGFHDEAKNVDVLRDAEGRLSQDDSA